VWTASPNIRLRSGLCFLGRHVVRLGAAWVVTSEPHWGRVARASGSRPAGALAQRAALLDAEL